MLGQREPDTYGSQTLETIVEDLQQAASDLGVELVHYQSNAESTLIEHVHAAFQHFDGIIINPAAFTHTSVVLRDALLSVAIPFVEVHLSNVHAREEFRRHSYFSDIAIGVICGFGAHGYRLALSAVTEHLK